MLEGKTCEKGRDVKGKTCGKWRDVSRGAWSLLVYGEARGRGEWDEGGQGGEGDKGTKGKGCGEKCLLTQPLKINQLTD